MKGQKFIPLFMMAMIGLLMTCAKEEAEYPVVIETIDGIKTVSNPDYPRDGVYELAMVEELSIGGDVDDEDYIFHRPQGIDVAADGTIYVMDWGDSTFKLYDKEGRYIRTVGGRGQGPNEFGQLVYFSLGSGERLCVLDPVNNRIAVLNLLGEYIGGFKIEEGFLTELGTDSRDQIYVGLSLRDEDFQWLNIRSFNLDGEPLADYGDFQLVQSIISKRKTDQGITTSSITSRHAATTVWKVNPQGKLYAGYGDDYVISVYNLDGSLEFKFGREYTPVSNISGGNTGQPDEVGVFNVLTRHWVFDGDGNIWVPFYTGEDPEFILYDVFSPEGIYTKQIQVKHRIMKFFEGKTYCFVRDENDFVAVKRFALTENGSGSSR